MRGLKERQTLEVVAGSRKPGTRSPDNQLNRAIISFLQKDGRMPFAEISQLLGVSEGTIRNRVASMKKAGLLQIVAITDPALNEYRTDAMLCLKVAPGATPQAVAGRLAGFDEVVYILWVSGRFDLLVEVVSDDPAQFLEFLDRNIHGQTDIATTETMTGLRNFKNQFLLKRVWSDGDD